jgi:anti-sigma factor RsiW
MDCREVRKQLMAFVDDELDPGASYEVDRHLAACTCCRGEADSIRAYDVRVRGACQKGACCEELRGRMARALEGEIAEVGVRSARRRSVARRTAAMAAVALITAGLAIGLWPGPAAAAFVDDHVRCRDMDARWFLHDACALGALCHQEAGPRAVIVSLEGAGYKLKGGAICRIEGVPYVHLTYEAPGRPVVSIFVGRCGLGGLAGRLRGVQSEPVLGFETVRMRCWRTGTEYVAIVPPGEAEILGTLAKAQVE